MLNNTILRMIAYCAGFGVILLGILVCIGWFGHYLILIQINTHFSPMQFTTALFFILSGISLILILKRQYLISRYFSAPVFIFTLLILIEYLGQLNLGIDQLFIHPFISATKEYPGRMAPNTALGFLCSAYTLWLLAAASYKHIKSSVSLFIILIVIMLGIIGIISYLPNFTTHYGSGQWIRMALHSAIGFILLSGGFLCVLYLNKRKTQYLPFIPLLATFLIILLTFLGWQFLKKSQDEYLNQMIQAKAENVRNTINVYMQERSRSFQRIVYRWIARPQTPENEWRSDVMHYISDQPGYKAIQWADNTFHIRWIEPKTNNLNTVGFNLLNEPQHFRAITEAMANKTMTITPLIHLIDGGDGVLLLSPIYKKQHFDGFIIGVLNTQRMLEHLIQTEIIKGYKVNVNDGNQLIYTSNPSPSLYPKWGKCADFNLFGQKWKITVWPTQDLFQQIKEYWFPLIT
ncbi:MAG: CHASE domain-containing protein, partial [bacterium]|nr:CHASE domain-containing protein [bacterium]